MQSRSSRCVDTCTENQSPTLQVLFLLKKKERKKEKTNDQQTKFISFTRIHMDPKH